MLETVCITSMKDQNQNSGTMFPVLATQLTLPPKEQPPNNLQNMVQRPEFLVGDRCDCGELGSSP